MRSAAPWLVLILFGCAPADQPAQRAAVDSVQPAQAALSSLTVCDAVAGYLREGLELAAQREDGIYTDARGVQRSGCRFTASGSFNAVREQAGLVSALEQPFTRRGWRPDLRYMGDGPDGSIVGLRRLEQLCVLYASWPGYDDADTTTVAPDPDPRYDVAIECSRDVATNTDTGVPDSLWQTAVRAGIDRDYAISLSLQYPPYLDGDFDGDGVADAAVLVEQRSTGKLGVAIVRRGVQQVDMLGAGARDAGPDDLSRIDAWERFPKGTTLHLTIGDRPATPLIGDALWVGRRDSVSAFYVWDGRRFIYEEHLR